MICEALVITQDDLLRHRQSHARITHAIQACATGSLAAQATISPSLPPSALERQLPIPSTGEKVDRRSRVG